MSQYGSNGSKWCTIRSSTIYGLKYLESLVAADGGCDRDVVHIMNEG